MALSGVTDYRQLLTRFDLRTLAIPGLVLLILSMLILPFPPWLLDLLFTFNIVLGLLILMVAINTFRPLDFSSFPAVLLLATMLRLGLNIASTRVVLVNGHEGTDSAGKVIEAFGEVVISGNYVVGFIVFAILMIINFIVVTKGAGRVSEVIARFTLDALPGKQMAIDADLSSGVIDQDTARKRREEIAQESDFFGSMDGASKFVRGDAIAGLLILFINIIGGLLIGTLQHDMSFADAARIYILLTIGDGLVAQIPSLLLALATAIVVTRVTTTQSVTEQASSQLGQPAALYITGGILLALGTIPGMPHLMFLLLGGGAIVIGFLIQRSNSQTTLTKVQEEERAKLPENALNKELDWSDIEPVDLIGLEVGYALIPLVDTEANGPLLARVKGVRKKLSAELGFLIHPVRIRDNLELGPNQYRIVIKGVVRGRGEMFANKDLAINPGTVYGTLDGVATREPAFGLEAFWIDPGKRDYAQTLGYTVVDPSTAIATHLNTLLRNNAAELLSHDESQQMLDKLAARSPKLVEELIPERLSLGTVTRVLQNLLAEGVPIRDLRTIMEGLAENVAKTQDPDALTAAIRPRLGRLILQELVDQDATLQVMTLEPNLEQLLHNVLQQSHQNQGMVIDPSLAERLFASLAKAVQQMEGLGHTPVLVVTPGIRSWLSRVTRHRLPDLTVLSYSEIPEDASITVVSSVSANS